MPTVIVAGALANKPRNGGEAWVRMTWVLGLERLGLDVHFVEQIDPGICVDAEGDPATLDESINAAYFDAVAGEFGVASRATLVNAATGSPRGRSRAELLELADNADLLVNISGHLHDEQLVRRPRHRAYIDLDPAFTQFWHADGQLGGQLERHDSFFTVGLSLGTPECAIPLDGIDWRPLPPPVLLDQWPLLEPPGEQRWTTVASWRGGYGRVEREGQVYGAKAHEFRRYAALPRRVPHAFEIALDIHPGDGADKRMLEDHGWQLVDPLEVAGDPERFRRYVQGSGAEFSVAQGIYVETASGWFSDRTTRYLASGKPVLVQDTGFSRTLPTGEGLVTFRTLDEAVAGADAIMADYERHAAAARALAEEHFDSDRVLGQLLEDALA
jgi:hypothetical protein